MTNTVNETILNNAVIDDDIPAWKRLDNVIRGWVALSNFEKDLESYAELKRSYE